MKKTLIAATMMLGLLGGGFARADTNVAVLGTASSSSELHGWADRGAASHANDGDIQGDYWAANGVAHTDFEAAPWWQVQLDHGYTVNSINLFNRTDCCSERLNNFTVTLYDGVTSVFSGTYANFTASIFEPTNSGMAINLGGVFGDRVRVQLNDANYLQLAEVQVSAVPEPDAYLMFLIGFGLLGLTARTTKKEKFTA